MKQRIIFFIFILVIAVGPAIAQTTEFTYQGQLQISSVIANGNFDFEFALFDSSSGGSQVGSTQTRNGVGVANGIFSVNLDFGNGFPGASRFLEIRVRQSGGGSFTTLSPRQPISSAPYAVKSITSDSSTVALNALTANNATNAQTAVSLSGPLAGDVTGTQNSTAVGRLQGRTVANTAPTTGQVLKYNGTQWEPGTDNTGGGGGSGTITGVTAGTGLTGGGVAGTVSVGIANGGVGTTQIADGSVTDPKIVTVSGAKITGAVANATNAATATTATTAVSLSGPLAGDVTGTQAATTIATNAVTTTKIADGSVTSPKIATGQVIKSVNTLKDDVTLAAGANITITPAGNTLTIASTGGGNAILNQVAQQAGANFNISGTGTANVLDATTQYNIGGSRVLSVAGTFNLFAGVRAGQANTTGFENAFFGTSAGLSNTNGSFNAFFGNRAGESNTTGDGNTFLGRSTGVNTTNGTGNAFFGLNSGFSNRTGSSNTMIGSNANVASGNLSNATAIGADAIVSASNSLVLGNNANVGIGTSAPITRLDVRGDVSIGASTLPGAVQGGNSLLIGNDGGTFLNSFRLDAAQNNLFVIASSQPGANANAGIVFRTGLAGTGENDRMSIDGAGNVRIEVLGSAGATTLCRNASNQISTCSSSLRYKTNIGQFSQGMSFVNKLRPITYDWKDGGMKDVGFGAEDIAKIDPRFVTYNNKGEVEGVKYDRLSVAFVNAFKEQQTQIESQQTQIEQQRLEIEALKALVCRDNMTAAICKIVK